MSNPFCRRGQRADPADRAEIEHAAAMRSLATATRAEVETGALAPDTTPVTGCGLTHTVDVALLLGIAAHTAPPPGRLGPPQRPSRHP